MSTKAAHTPTPWRLITEGDGEDEMIVRTMVGPNENVPRNLNETCFFTTGSFSDEVEQANAEFAFIAVQAQLAIDANIDHAGLVLAVKDADETLKKLIQ